MQWFIRYWIRLSKIKLMCLNFMIQILSSNLLNVIISRFDLYDVIVFISILIRLVSYGKVLSIKSLMLKVIHI